MTTPSSPRIAQAAPNRWLPWVVAMALFMEQLDTTIVNTTMPAMAASLGSTPLALKAVAASYIVSLAMTIPLAGWMTERFGTRAVFRSALAVFTLSSLACALATSVDLLVAARVPQGMAAAMMMPVGRIAILRSTPKAELMRTMNFVIMPALLGPLLGPTLGGVIVHLASWREVFLINLPVGLVAMAMAHLHMPEHRSPQPPPLDVVGLALFGGGVALLSYALEMFGSHELGAWSLGGTLGLSAALLAAYGWHARHTARPLLSAAPFARRSFRVSVLGGAITRLGVGGMPFLLPLLYQLGLGRPAWQSGLLMAPAAAAAMVMKPLSQWLLRRFGHRQVLQANTLLVAASIAAYSTVTAATPLAAIVALGFVMGLGNSLQFSSMNSLAYADVPDDQTAMASTIASTAQQLSMSVGLACGAIAAALFLRGGSTQNPAQLLPALHGAFLLLAAATAVSALCFRSLRAGDGASVSQAAPAAA